MWTRRRWRHIRSDVIREIRNSWRSGRIGRAHARPRLHLLQMVGYPDVANLTEAFGGRCTPGPGWRDRDDGCYQNPISLERLRAANLDYVRRRTSGGSVAPHSDVMLAELIDESLDRPEHLDGGRSGHSQSPTSRTWILWWNIPENVFAATSFAIIQEDENGKVKIRRGEDWRRSSHNATVRAWDVPTHHMVGDFVSMPKKMADARSCLHVFGHDLLNAYRQWPVRHPSHNATFLHTEHGLTLWFHLAMCFGAAASVWNFNRVADALQLLTRTLLLLVGGHYVDDFNGIEYAEHSDSAFHAFSEFFHVLGLKNPMEVVRSCPIESRLTS